MPRYKFILEYDGGPFSGWQRQEGAPITVQQVLEEAAHRLTQEAVAFYGSGRTDKGVHACGQVAHADFQKSYTEDRLRRGLNYYLKNQAVVVLAVEAVPEEFHARFSARFRRYHYHILNRPSPPILENTRAWWVCRPLDLVLMQRGAGYLVGHHNFAGFRGRDCQSSRTWRTLEHCHIKVQGEHLIIEMQAPAFLQQQVRITVGTLKQIGTGYWPPEKICDLLENPCRAHAGPTAPARGLFLMEVGY